VSTDLLFFETSAKTNQNIEEMFIRMTQLMLDRIDKGILSLMILLCISLHSTSHHTRLQYFSFEPCALLKTYQHELETEPHNQPS
jgi:hypothetical protein